MFQQNFNPCMNCIHMMNMNYSINPMEDPDIDDLDDMYPKIYSMMLPHIMHHCDKLELFHGPMYTPYKSDILSACDEICEKIEPELDECGDDEERYDGFYLEADSIVRRYTRRRAVRDMARILMLRELRRRRIRRPTPWHHGYHPGYHREW